MNKEEVELHNDLKQLTAGLVLAYEDWRENLDGDESGLDAGASSCLFYAAKQADAIKVLIELDKVEAAMILLRPLIEAYITCAYLFAGDNEANMIRFMYEGDQLDLENTKKYRDFVESIYTKPKYTPEMFNELIEKYKKGIDETRNHNFPLKRMPNLRTRAEMLVDYYGCPDFGELYFNSYLLLCNSNHPSASHMAEIGMSGSFDERWYGRGLGRIKDTVAVTNGVLASMIVFLEKYSGIKLNRNSYLTSKLINHHNRFVEYDQLKKQ